MACQLLFYLFGQSQKEIGIRLKLRSPLSVAALITITVVQFFLSDNLISQITYKDKTWVASFEELTAKKEITVILKYNNSI